MSITQYAATEWQNGESPAINATNLNKLEAGVSSNSSNIISLQNKMEFKGTTSTLPVSANIGDVYQALAADLVDSNAIGDLLIYVDTDTWNVVPCGEQAFGTVTNVETGSGLSGGPITGSGTISIDPDYTATSSRNGLLSSSNWELLNNVGSSNCLQTVAITGDFSDLDNIPDSALRELTQTTNTSSGSENKVMSQKAISLELDGKADSVHTHTIAQVTDLSDYLAKDDNLDYIQASAVDHKHGLISSDGLFLNAQGEPVTTAQYLVTNSSGQIISSPSIPCGVISGSSNNSFIFGNGANAVNISQLKADSESYASILDDCIDESQLAATKVHTHDIFTTNTIEEIDQEEVEQPGTAGFVPPSPAEDANQYILFGNATWGKLSSFAVTSEKNEFIKFYTDDLGISTLSGALQIVTLNTDPGDDYDYKDNVLYLIVDEDQTIEQGE